MLPLPQLLELFPNSTNTMTILYTYKQLYQNSARLVMDRLHELSLEKAASLFI